MILGGAALALAAGLSGGCGRLKGKPAVGTFREARTVADAKALAWDAGATLYYFGGTMIGGDGSATGSGAWTLKYLAPSKPGLEFAIVPGEPDGLAGALDGDVDSGVDPATASAAIAAWGGGPDSGKWFADAGWTAEDHPDGLYFAAGNAIPTRVNRCARAALDCLPDAEDGALFVELLSTDEAGRPVAQPNAVELAPTYRVLPVRRPMAAPRSDGGAHD